MNEETRPSAIRQDPAPPHIPVLKVVGLGGGGSNAVNRMIELGLSGVEFVAANTDVQALVSSLAPVKVQLGPDSTRGLGAGGKPEVGRLAAQESAAEIKAALEGADMVFLTAGMGGGTGTGSIGVVAQIAKSMGAIVIAVVTTPFSFEGYRIEKAMEGLEQLQPYTDTMITIPNDRILHTTPKETPMDIAFRFADDVLRQAVQGISELITEPGIMNVDFAHVRQVILNGGGALMAIGQGEGENKALKAVKQALNHPLLETVALDTASAIIANFTSSEDLGLTEIGEAINHLQGLSYTDIDLVLGVNQNPNFQNRSQVILIVTGLGATTLEDALRSPGTASRRPSRVSTIPTAAPTRTPSSVTSNLDIPAFMRRKDRYQVGVNSHE